MNYKNNNEKILVCIQCVIVTVLRYPFNIKVGKIVIASTVQWIELTACSPSLWMSGDTNQVTVHIPDDPNPRLG
jgi:hypothetical protein